MEVGISSNFGTADYYIFVAMLVISALIGACTSLCGNASPEEFLMGNRALGVLPVSMSLLTSFVSSFSLLGISGEAYANGIQLSLFVVGTSLGITAVGLVILPVIYPLKLTSINEYIALRFNSRLLHACISLMTCARSIIFMGVCLYPPAAAFASITNLSYVSYIFILGAISTVYSSFGGIRAVVYTDVFQLSVIMIGLITLDVIGCKRIGGLINTWSISLSGGRLELFNMNPSLYERHTFFNTIGYGFFYYAALFGAAQINIQKMCCVGSLGKARKALMVTVLGMFVLQFLLFTGGLIAYANYAGCDPLAKGLINKKEDILPYFIVDRLSFIPGLSGMFISTLIGGTLSSLSSVVNTTVAVIWRDWCLKLKTFQKASPNTSMLANKLLSIFIGSFLIGLALLFSQVENVTSLLTTVTTVSLGPVFGVFLIGFLFPKCNIIGTWVGFVTSVIFISWASIGALYTVKEDPTLPFSISGCDGIESFVNNSSFAFANSPKSVRNFTQILEHNSEQAPLSSLYDISYTLYSIISPVVCVLVANIVSLLTGGQNKSNVSPKYISPIVHRLYWTCEELQYFKMKNNAASLYDVQNFDVCDDSDYETSVEYGMELYKY